MLNMPHSSHAISGNTPELLLKNLACPVIKAEIMQKAGIVV